MGNWTTGPSMLYDKEAFGFAVVNDKVHCIGGRLPKGRSELTDYASDHQVFDLSSQTWSNAARLPTPRHLCSCVPIGNKIYCIGGTEQAASAVMEIYDCDTDTWTTGTGMPTPRSSFVAVNVGDRIHCIGSDSPETSQVHEVYDPVSNRWSTLASLPGENTRSARGLAIENLIYVLHGYNNRPIQVYNVQTNTWKTKGRITVSPRHYLGCCAFGRQIYCMGGTYYTAQSNFEIYDIDTEKYQVQEAMPVAKAYPVCVAYENKIYCIGSTLDDEEHNVHIYHVETLPTTDITIQYLDESGTAVTPDVLQIGYIGQSFTTTAPTIPGYRCTGHQVDGGTLQTGAIATIAAVQEAGHTITFFYETDEGGGSVKGCCCAKIRLIADVCQCNQDALQGMEQFIRTCRESSGDCDCCK